MAQRTDSFDLGGMHLSAGEGRRLDLHVAIDPFSFGGESYAVEPGLADVRLDISRTTGGGYAMRLRFQAALEGPCMRCLEAAAPAFEVDTREVHQPREGEELASPYIDHEILNLRGWVRDALALALPAQVVCRDGCAGMCAICGANLNTAGPEHHHEREPDPRWAKLSELRFE